MAKYKRPSSRYPRNWNRLRFAVFKRDKYRCQLCGIRTSLKNKHGYNPNCHHIVPLGMGGSNNMNNLMTLCKRCHEFIHAEYIRKKKNESL